MNDAPGGVGRDRLRFDLNSVTLMNLPAWSNAPAGPPATVYAAVRAAGYRGLQHDAPVDAAFAAGLRMTGHGRVVSPHEAAAITRSHRDAGFDATTLHLGHGLEDDDAAFRLVEAVLDAAIAHRYPLFVETHRATLLQDMWRTLRLVDRFPELRFCADLSHWYTGLEMPYGDFAGKLDALRPVFDRVRFMHGRIGNSSCMQVAVDEADPAPDFMRHYRAMWMACARGFLGHAAPDETLIFAPELLPAVVPTDDGPITVNYARLDRDGVEESDRWDQALRLCAIMADCFAAAQAAPASQPMAEE